MLPAAVSLRKQGADKGAVSAFLISTPESGIDSIAVTYALMDPVMTVARPAAAFITAAGAGLAENFHSKKEPRNTVKPDLSCPVDACCDGVDCDPKAHRAHHTFSQKIRAAFGFAFKDLWEDMSGWFFLGVLLAGLITGFVPDDFMSRYLGGGLPAMLLMLVPGIPLYICATASTPIAAALVLKGVSPGAALVFLLVGPATNITSLTVLAGTLGKRSTGIYLGAIALFSVLCGLILDALYGSLGLSAVALAQHPKEFFPPLVGTLGALFLLTLFLGSFIRKRRPVNSDAASQQPATEQSGAPEPAPPSPFFSENSCACGKPT